MIHMLKNVLVCALSTSYRGNTACLLHILTLGSSCWYLACPLARALEPEGVHTHPNFCSSSTDAVPWWAMARSGSWLMSVRASAALFLSGGDLPAIFTFTLHRGGLGAFLSVQHGDSNSWIKRESKMY